MRRDISIVFLCIAAIVGLFGCSADDSHDPFGESGEARIVAGATLLSQPSIETKAPYNETTPSGGSPLKARVLASKTDGNYNELYANGTMTFTGNGKTPYDVEGFSGKNYYELDDSPLHFVALYPAAGWTAAPTTTASFTFTGKEDVMFAPQSTSRISLAAERPQFTFNHLLTKLNFTLVAENEALQDAWGEITELALIDANNQVTVTLGYDIATAASFTGTASLKAHRIDGDTPVSSSSTIPIALASDESEAQAYILAAPVTAGAGDEYSLSIKSSNGSERTVGLNLKTAGVDFTGSTRGCSFNVLLNFQGKEIEVEVSDTSHLSMSDWATSLVLQTVMLTSDREKDRAKMIFALNALNLINKNSVSHTYTYFGMYGVNDVAHDILFDVAALTQADLLSSFKPGQHVMFDLKKLVRTWGKNPDNNDKPWEVTLINYATDWELAKAKQTIKMADHTTVDWEQWASNNGYKLEDLDGITSATLPADFPKKDPQVVGETVTIPLSTTLTDKGTIIIKRK